MLHKTILPDHKEWAAVFKGLKIVVIDEAHTYHGGESYTHG